MSNCGSKSLRFSIWLLLDLLYRSERDQNMAQLVKFGGKITRSVLLKYQYHAVILCFLITK